jgi:hypothetical protein
MVFTRRITKKQMVDQKYSLNNSAYTNFTAPTLKTSFNIAIIQPGSWGDNINSTLMFKPIKAQYPGSQIDVYTTSSYYSAFDNNPYIDNFIVAEAVGKNMCLNFVHIFPDLIKDFGYQAIINASPCINPGSWSSCRYPGLGENLILSWARALDNLSIEYELPLETILQLRQPEIDKIDNFYRQLNAGQMFKVLMEVEGESGQSFWNPRWTYEVCQKILSRPNTLIFISKRYTDNVINTLIEQHPNRVKFIGDFSIRECAHLYNKCDAFISISSGLSNACNTNWCKNDIIWIEVVNSTACSSYPIRSEGKTFWHQNDLEFFKQQLTRLLYGEDI